VDADVETELNLIVDAGGTVEDIFVYHKVYGTVRAQMGIKNRLQVKSFLESIASGKSSLLKNVTSGYHYHTVNADSAETLDVIEKQLNDHGFLAPLQEYEPNEITKNI
jgi:transcriptional regulator of NAD metabolism